MSDTLVDLLAARAAEHPARVAFTFLRDGEDDAASVDYAWLDAQARRIADGLRGRVRPGARALLLYQYPAGIEFVAAFFGCLYARVIAVPAYPPDPNRLKSSLPRLQSILADSEPEIALSTSAMCAVRDALAAELSALAAIPWMATDDPDLERLGGWLDAGVDARTVAFLQYTSGSTAEPKGVTIRHANALHNQRLIQAALRPSRRSIGVGWLPLYHDMGLIGNVLGTVFTGMHCVLMSPLHFLQQPARWLRAIAKYRGTHSGGPNYGYELCIQRVKASVRESIDLRSWQVAFNGAEPPRKTTLERFTAAFAPSGFSARRFYACYGLAEATLLVSGHTGEPRARKLDRHRYEAGAIEEHEGGEVTVVSSGQPVGETRVEIVDPETCAPCPPDRIGEVWVKSASVASGYWNRPEESSRSFEARLAPSGDGPFLRTGDFGFFGGGHLYIAGRMKDVIIVRGRKLHPQDIELTVESADPGVRAAGVAAFAIQVDGEEGVAVVAAIDPKRGSAGAEVLAAIRRDVVEVHQIQPYVIALVRPGNLPRTSSGKIQRQACRTAFLNGTFDVIAEWRSPSRAVPSPLLGHGSNARSLP